VLLNSIFYDQAEKESIEERVIEKKARV